MLRLILFVVTILFSINLQAQSDCIKITNIKTSNVVYYSHCVIFNSCYSTIDGFSHVVVNCCKNVHVYNTSGKPYNAYKNISNEKDKLYEWDGEKWCVYNIEPLLYGHKEYCKYYCLCEDEWIIDECEVNRA